MHWTKTTRRRKLLIRIQPEGPERHAAPTFWNRLYQHHVEVSLSLTHQTITNRLTSLTAHIFVPIQNSPFLNFASNSTIMIINSTRRTGCRDLDFSSVVALCCRATGKHLTIIGFYILRRHINVLLVYLLTMIYQQWARARNFRLIIIDR